MIVAPTKLTLDETVYYGESSCAKYYVHSRPGFLKYASLLRKQSLVLSKKKKSRSTVEPTPVPGFLSSMVTDIRAFIVEKQKEDDFFFKKWEFFALVLFLDVTNRRISDFERMTYTYGLILSTFYYILHTLFVDIPLRMFLIFIASYTQKHAFTVFQCMSLLKGLGYTMVANMFLAHVRPIEINTAILLMLYDVLAGNEWMHCEHIVASTNKTCVPMNNQIPRNTHCPKWPWKQDRYNTHLMATQYYFRFASTDRVVYSPVVKVVTETLIQFCIFVPSVLFCMFYRRFAHKCILLMCACIVIALITIIAFAIYNIATIPRTIYLEPFPYADVPAESYVLAVINLFDINSNCWISPLIIYVGTRKPPDLTPEKAAIVSCTMRLVFIVIFSTLYGVLFVCVNSHYNFPKSSCLYYRRHEILIVVLTDLVARASLKTFWLSCWFLSVVLVHQLYYGYLIITTAFAINNMSKKFMNHWYLLNCSIAAVAFVLSALCIQFDLMQEYIDEDFYWRVFSCFHLTALAWGISFLYTIRQIKEDYLFQYGMMPHTLWTAVLSYLPYIILAMLIKSLTSFDINQETSLSSYFSLSCFICCMTLHTAILIKKVFKRIISGNSIVLSLPEQTWGPYDAMLRKLRMCYISDRDIKWKYETPKCRHRCLLHSPRFYMMRDRQNVVADTYLSMLDTNST